jgi:hypothetical protein
MKYNIKKEFEEELRHVKGLIGESQQSLLLPIVSELTALLEKWLKAARVIVYLYNREIDHLYSLPRQGGFNPQAFGVDTIRMKSSLGQAGRAFTTGKVTHDDVLVAEERDLAKLRIDSVRNAVSIPVIDRQSTSSVAVITAFNSQAASEDDEVLMSLGNVLSSVLFAVEVHQGFLMQHDVLECCFNLGTDGIILLNSTGTVTKLNKSAEIILNTQLAVGQNVAELLGSDNSHLFDVVRE